VSVRAASSTTTDAAARRASAGATTGMATTARSPIDLLMASWYDNPSADFGDVAAHRFSASLNPQRRQRASVVTTSGAVQRASLYAASATVAGRYMPKSAVHEWLAECHPMPEPPTCSLPTLPMVHEAEARATRLARRAPVDVAARVTASTRGVVSTAGVRCGHIRSTLAALKRAAPEIVRDSGVVAGPALCRVGRAPNSARIPSLATTFWQTHPQIAPISVDFGLSANAFVLGANASLAPDALLDAGLRHVTPESVDVSGVNGGSLSSTATAAATARQAGRRAFKKRDGVSLHPMLVRP